MRSAIVKSRNRIATSSRVIAQRLSRWFRGDSSISLASMSWFVTSVAGVVLVVAYVLGSAAVVNPSEVTPKAVGAPVDPLPHTPPPDPTETHLNWGPSLANETAAFAVVRRMSDEELAGQLLIARYFGSNPAAMRGLFSNFHVGGVIIGSGSIINGPQTHALVQEAHQASEASGRSWPAIVAVDQEGGKVARLDGIISEMPTFLAAGAARDKSAVETAFLGMAAEVRGLGFTVNFAPVADATIGLSDPTIGSRSAGSDHRNVGESVVAAMDGLIDGGVIPSVKHFPGHGSVTTDSHALMPVQTRSVEQMQSLDFVPFSMAVDAGAPMIMMGHINVPEWGPRPATIEPAAYQYLRTEMGFSGVIVTDSMGMGAVHNPYGSGGSTIRALKSGADIVLMPVDTAQAHRAIVAALRDGSLTRSELEFKAARVVAMMMWQAEISPQSAPDGDYARQYSRDSITVASPACGQPLVSSTVTISGGSSRERNALAAALATHGISVRAGGTSIRLLGRASSAGNADVVVALDGPWGLRHSRATHYVGVYGDGTPQLQGLADVLAGAALPTAEWPVDVGALPYPTCGSIG